MIEFFASWPRDADGDVLRRMQLNGADFTRPYVVDFNVDFDSWPPPTAAIDLLEKHYPGATVFDPDGNGEGYILIQIKSIVSYELVVETQASVSALMAPYGGICESWGVLQA